LAQKVLTLEIWNYPQVDYYTFDNNGVRDIYNVVISGGPSVLSYIRHVILPDDVDIESITSTYELAPSVLLHILTAGIDIVSIIGGNANLWRFFIGEATEAFLEIFADEIIYYILSDDLIKTQNFSLSGKGQVNVKDSLNLDDNGTIWLWRVFFSVLSFDSRIVDVQYNNPNRFYFGLLSFSNFGAFNSPYWLRTQEHYAGVFQVTPNPEGKDSGDDAGFPNLLYPYARCTGFSYDLRKSVLAQAKVSAVKVMSQVTNWW
jgi:hypothetical protein